MSNVAHVFEEKKMRKIVLIVVGLVSLFLCGTTFAAEQNSGEGPAGPKSMGEMNPNDEMGGPGDISGDGYPNALQADDPDDYYRKGDPEIDKVPPLPEYLEGTADGK